MQPQILSKIQKIKRLHVKMINEFVETDTTIHEEITGMIVQKYSDAINNILLYSK